MKWRECAIQDLKKYRGLGDSIGNIEERLEALELNFGSIKSQRFDAMPLNTGTYKTEDAIIDNIVECERLKMLLEANKKLHAIISRGLEALSKTERMVLERFFIFRCENHLSRLMDELNVEQAQVYRIKDNALYKFTVCMYGIEEY